MVTDRCQRARGRVVRWRPAGEVINTRQYEVAAILGAGADTVARKFVVQHHYSASYPAAVRRFGLFAGGKLRGVAVFSMPWQRSLDRVRCPWDNRATIELSRFVLLDSVAGNGETWFMARCFALLRREGWAAVLSYSDPQPRRNGSGGLVFPGHVGTIYQAHNASYLGRASARTLHLFPDGSVFSERVQSKIRKPQQGSEYAIATLVARGADPPPTNNYKEWLTLWRTRLCRPLRHPGNHTYLWALQARQKRFLPTSLRYPKFQ